MLLAPERMYRIDRQARAWQKAMIRCWCGHANPRLYPWEDALIAALFLEHHMDGPLADDRLELVYAATRRVDPSKEALVTLALCDYVEDGKRGDTATLPYSLAWARAGQTLNPRTGLPGGIARARWPMVPE